MVLVFNRNKKQTLPRNNRNGDAAMKEYQTRIGLLCDIAEEANSITQVSTLLERILKVTQNTVGSSITSLFLKDEDKARVHLPITVSNYEDDTARRATVIETEIADMVAGNIQPLKINDVSTDPRFNPNGKKSSSFVVRSVIAGPVLKGKKVIGVIMAANKDSGGAFTQRDFEILKGFAATEALILLVSLEKTAIENVNSLNPTLVEGYLNAVHELASTIDVKDDHVYEHARRVKEYALIAAASLSLAPRELQAIEFGALLHDIGKIGIDSEILRKPGPLTDGEWNIVYKHPQKGADILKDIPHLKDAMNIVLCHHERYDGTGYPRKLKGEEIPVGARLVAVANAFDTMVTSHSYRAALSIDKAIKELINETGSQFCPKAIEAFISAYNKRRASPPVKADREEPKIKAAKPTIMPIIKVETEPKNTTKNLVIKVKKDEKYIKNLKEKAAKQAKEAKVRAEKEAKEARARAEKEAREAKLLKAKFEKDAKEAKIRAEKQAKEAKVRAEKAAKEARARAEKETREAKLLKVKSEKDAKEAKIRAEKQAKEAKVRAEKEAKEARLIKIKAEKVAKIQAEKVAREAKLKAQKDAKEAKLLKAKSEKEAKEAKIRAEKEAEEAKKSKKEQQERKATAAKKYTETYKGNVRLTIPIKASAEAVRTFAQKLPRIIGVKIIMLSHSEEEGHLFLLSLEKPIALIRCIKDLPGVEDVDRKGGTILVNLVDELI